MKERVVEGMKRGAARGLKLAGSNFCGGEREKAAKTPENFGSIICDARERG